MHVRRRSPWRSLDVTVVVVRLSSSLVLSHADVPRADTTPTSQQCTRPQLPRACTCRTSHPMHMHTLGRSLGQGMGGEGTWACTRLSRVPHSHHPPINHTTRLEGETFLIWQQMAAGSSSSLLLLTRPSSVAAASFLVWQVQVLSRRPSSSPPPAACLPSMASIANPHASSSVFAASFARSSLSCSFSFLAAMLAPIPRLYARRAL